jgi:hypothetical protein
MTYFAPKVSNPVADKDSAETFAESKVTVTGSDVALDPLSQGSTVTRAPDGSNGFGPNDRTEQHGIKIAVKSTVSRIEAVVSDDTGTFAEARIVDLDNNIVASVTGPFTANDTVSITALLEPGKEYGLVGYDNGDTWIRGRVADINLPNESADVDIVESWRGSSGNGTGAAFTFDSVTAFVPEGDSSLALASADQGTARVQWPMPPDIYSWDVGVYQAARDGETVNVYVEENQSGGWTEVAGPISRGDLIPADPSNNIRYRIELSRTDTANSPTLDAIYRRYKL